MNFYVIHHQDEDKLNDAIENLRCITKQEHMSYHARIRSKLKLRTG